MNKYEKVKNFLKRIKKSKSTLYRFYKKNEELYNETRMKKNNRLIPISHAKYFDSEVLHDENKLLRQENKSMRILIDCLMDKDSLPSTFWHMDWSAFMTVAYHAERNKKSCYKQMTAMYDSLIENFGDETDIAVFFTTEPFTNRKGYHNHFVLNVKKKSLLEEVINHITKFFKYDRVDYSIYDKYKAGIFYISKEGLVNEDWDILGNNLEGEEIRHAS
jgi:hypothetical protein